MILSAASSFIFTIFPQKLGQPIWQLNAISTLLGSSTNILIESLLISMARLFNPNRFSAQKNAAFIHKLAGAKGRLITGFGSGYPKLGRIPAGTPFATRGF